MTWNRLLLLFLLIALPTLASAAPAPLSDHQRGDAYAVMTTDVTCGVSTDVQIERASDPQLLPDLVPTVEDLELPGEVDWSRPYLYIGGLDGARRRPRRGKKRGGGLTTSQRGFQKAAKICQAELRAGELNTRAGMGACMREELKREGFNVGGRGRRKRKK